MRKIQTIRAACLIVIVAIPNAMAHAAEQQLFVGAAVRDTTPMQEWFPLSGTSRIQLGQLVGVIDPIHVRVIAVGNGETPALVVTFEAGDAPSPETFLPGLSRHTGVPTDAIYYGGTHGHSSPTTKIDPNVPATELYNKYVYEQMIAAADEAIAKMRPATVGIGYSESYINTNRQRFYELEDGTTKGAQGYNPTGPSDKTLSVIRFSDLQGKPIAFIVHYAVHNTTMYANRFDGNDNGVSADIAGAVSGHLEAKFEGAVANWIPGAAGDQNPIISNEYFTPNPETGEQEIQMMGRAVVELVEFYGKIQFADVLTALSNIQTVTSEARISYATGDGTLPPYTEGQQDVRIQLRMLRIGNIALVGTAGELFNSIGVYMQEHSLVEHTLVSNQVRIPDEYTHVEGVKAITSYQPDDYALIHDGWHTNNRRYAVGSINGGYTTLMNRMIESTKQQ
ncbi:MAG: hypothetical protein OEM85_00265 [Gammaproteobacteria bacterium]|nr:hypothetical protein [Gammaproteobacteria bacterium]